MSGMDITKIESPVDYNINPTRETYDAFQIAYDFFNWSLFNDKLPKCLITLQRRSRSYGYFRPRSLSRLDGIKTDEIALNPAHFRTRPIEGVLGTLVHEMVHLWQDHFGKPGRPPYHNREWAEKMKSVGLYPSSTGAPGGKETGDTMSHYIIEDGNFIRRAYEFLEKGFEIRWADIVKLEEDQKSGNKSKTKKSKSGEKPVFICPQEDCGQRAWGRSELQITCTRHKFEMIME